MYAYRGPVYMLWVTGEDRPVPRIKIPVSKGDRLCGCIIHGKAPSLLCRLYSGITNASSGLKLPGFY